MGCYFSRPSKFLPPPSQFVGPLFGLTTVGPTDFFFSHFLRARSRSSERRAARRPIPPPAALHLLATPAPAGSSSPAPARLLLPCLPATLRLLVTPAPAGSSSLAPTRLLLPCFGSRHLLVAPSMDHGGGGSSSRRLQDRLARMFRPASLLRSTCNTVAEPPKLNRLKCANYYLKC